MGKILIIAAHPDDEALGAGGTIIKHIKNGDDVAIVFLATGIYARRYQNKKMKRDLDNLKICAKKAAEIMGVKKKNVYFCRFKDNEMDKSSLLEIVRTVEGFVKKIQPDIIYTHHHNDINIDHRITFQAVLTATRPQGKGIKKLLSFEVPSSSEWNIGRTFSPNVYIDIKDEIGGKIKTLQAYKSEMRDYPHPRSLEGVKILAQHRGLMVGKEYVEAFELIREIKR